MKSKFFYLLLFFACIFFACKADIKKEATASEKTNIISSPAVISKKLSPKDFTQKLASSKNPQLIDVRTPQEFNQGHLSNAVNINYHGDFFIEELRKLDKNRSLFVYCQSGVRSEKACYKLKKMGFKEVYDMQGGYLDWLDKE